MDWIYQILSPKTLSNPIVYNTLSYSAERPPTISLMLAVISRPRCAPRIASPVKMPRYSWIVLPSTLGIVVMTIFASSKSCHFLAIAPGLLSSNDGYNASSINSSSHLAGCSERYPASCMLMFVLPVYKIFW